MLAWNWNEIQYCMRWDNILIGVNHPDKMAQSQEMQVFLQLVQQKVLTDSCNVNNFRAEFQINMQKLIYLIIPMAFQVFNVFLMDVSYPANPFKKQKK